ncbi:hypothetical protein BDP55DRAFT_629800 [Colletotrichum godetiae]|uniref:Uncharacterized protein n=1 Tax=Colletotrichum godetiae TaxID=1209918 RepID=A0AAJ0APV8_9PEZI|nr:uncharacterized protein BDP55DRAFT_629800 [Colletotrichum godetiae]KAK1688192.1 hypothetical protein BDP55DRAFT_629800 [Colletotrichum godetiae]
MLQREMGIGLIEARYLAYYTHKRTQVVFLDQNNPTVLPRRSNFQSPALGDSKKASKNDSKTEILQVSNPKLDPIKTEVRETCLAARYQQPPPELGQDTRRSFSGRAVPSPAPRLAPKFKPSQLPARRIELGVLWATAALGVSSKVASSYAPSHLRWSTRTPYLIHCLSHLPAASQASG